MRYAEYPYTIEYEVEKDEDGLFFFPGLRPIPYYNISSQESRSEIISPVNYTVRYKEMNMDEPLVKEEIVDRAYESKAIGFLERWSKRKYLKKIERDKVEVKNKLQ